MTSGDPEFDRLKAETMSELDDDDRLSGINPDLVPPAPATPPGPPPVRKLERAPDTPLAGVAAGLGHYFNIDVVVVRIALLIFAVSTGIGFLLYLAAAVVMPKADVWPPPQAPAVGWRDPLRWDRNATALAVVAGLVIIISLSGSAPTQLVLAALLVAGGVWLLNERPQDQTSSIPSTPAPPAPPSVTSPAPAAAPAFSAAPAYGTGAPAALATGKRRLGPLRVLGAMVLAVFGLTLLAASSVNVELSSNTIEPTSVDDIPSSVAVTAGEIVLDLTGLTAEDLEVDAPHRIDLSAKAGSIKVTVPDDVPVRLTDDLTMGDRRVAIANVNPDDPLVILDISLVAGELIVERG